MNSTKKQLFSYILEQFCFETTASGAQALGAVMALAEQPGALFAFARGLRNLRSMGKWPDAETWGHDLRGLIHREPFFLPRISCNR